MDNFDNVRQTSMAFILATLIDTPLSQPTCMAPWEVLYYQLTKEEKKTPVYFYVLKLLLS